MTFPASMQFLSGLYQAYAERVRIRRAKEAMLKLDDQLLDDIGLSRLDIVLEGLGTGRPARL